MKRRQIFRGTKSQSRTGTTNVVAYETLEQRQMLSVTLVQPDPALADNPEVVLPGFDSKNLLQDGGFDSTASEDSRNGFTVGPHRGWQSHLPLLPTFSTIRDGKRTMVLELDSSADFHESIFQDVETNVGGRYLLTFDIRSRENFPDLNNKVAVRWNQELVGAFQASNHWQSVSVELFGGHSGLTRLQLSEQYDAIHPGGDGVGPVIDNVRLIDISPMKIENGGFENSPVAANTNGDTQVSAGWQSMQPSGLNIIERGFATEGFNLWKLNSSDQQLDLASRELDVTAGQQYVVTFDLLGTNKSDISANEVRLRWNDQWAGTFYGTEGWNTHSITFTANSTGTKLLVFREPGAQSANQSGGPLIDNVRVYHVGPLPPSGEGGFVLPEGNIFSFVNEALVPVDIQPGQEGLQQISFNIEPVFDELDFFSQVEDTFNVYLVDQNNPSDRILDSGIPGSALFSLKGQQAEFPAGLVTYDGSIVTIDVSSVANPESALLFQMISTDNDLRSEIAISQIQTQIFEDLSSTEYFLFSESEIQPGAEFKILPQNQGDLEISFDKIQFDEPSRLYTAEVTITNHGDDIGRDVAVLFRNNFPVLNSSQTGEVELLNRSGITPAGVPYINFRDAIPSGGLPTNSSSAPITIVFHNPTLRRFIIKPSALVGEPNRTPIFNPIPPITVMPGGFFEMQLSATDPDGDDLRWSLSPEGQLPPLMFDARGLLRTSPGPQDIGSYTFTITVTDGVEQVEQTVILDVVEDPITSTRISGFVLNTNQEPLADVPIELGQDSTMTNADGSFELEISKSNDNNTLIIHGEAWLGEETYPYIAEKLELLFDHELFPEFNNVISRPIYLPALDLAQADPVDPENDTIIDATLRDGEPPAELFIEAGSLEYPNGDLYDGVVHITEVPRDLTPAALPKNLYPDVVVTIQPGGLTFTDPAELTLPNRAGYEPGTVMDLWSINPESGQFEVVGVMEVSGDGSVVETISGGVTSSSWHTPVTPPEGPNNPNDDDKNPEPDCYECKETRKAASEVELHSGTILETHDLARYESLGATRGLTLHYDSHRADPRPILHFGYDNAQFGADRLLVARLEFQRGAFVHQVSGFAGGLGLPGGEHFWQLPDGTNDIRVALQGDFEQLPSGVYNYTLTTGLLQLGNDGVFTGSTSTSIGQISHVTATDSRFGAGWQLGGAQLLIENPDGSILLADGDGEVLLFGAASDIGQPYDSPRGDFTRLVKNFDGSYTRTTPDQTVMHFDDNGRLITVTDRNGNTTVHVYNQENQLTTIIDPVGLATFFTYTDGKVSQITDPALRSTLLDYYPDGNLIRIIDPDGEFRDFEYDARHHMVAETDKRGNREQTFYGFHGRAESALRKDGTTLNFSPAQTQLLYPATDTVDPFTAPAAAIGSNDAMGLYADGRGNVSQSILDKAGQAISTTDIVGNQGSVVRNDDNLVVSSTNGRGNTTEYTYDDRGNVLSITDGIIRAGLDGPLFPGKFFSVGFSPRSVTTGDFNGDGITDLATANAFSNDVSVLIGVGDGSFYETQNFGVGNGPHSVATGDFNGDGITDLAIANRYSDDVSVLIGVGDGTFNAAQNFGAGVWPQSVTTGDFNGDGITDLATANFSSDDVSVLIGVGDGTFNAPQNFGAGDGPLSVTTGDFNGDGITDLATANRYSNDVSALIGVGDGTFNAPQNFGTGDLPLSVTTGDFNRDGITDLATANSSSNNVSVLIGVGNGTFNAPQNFGTGIGPLSVTTGDFNGDGITDLATANGQSDDVSVLISVGDGTFNAAQNFGAGDGPLSVTTGDFNGDGITDLATANVFSDDVSVLFGFGDGTFAFVESFGAGDEPRSVTTGDFNGDGITDLATANRYSDDVSVLIGVGDGTFTTAQNFDADRPPWSVTTGDFNDDGITDLATSNGFSNDVSVLIGVGDGTYNAPQIFGAGNFSVSVTTGDFNGDGITDLATANFSSNNVSVLIGVGDGTFNAPQNFGTGIWPNSLTTGDFNGDGITDLATANSSSNNVSVLIGVGNGTFNAPQNFGTGIGPSSLTTGDFNGDGITDLATANFSSDDVSALIGVGDGTFNAPQNFGTDTSPYSVTAGDFNGDGITDLATANLSSNNVSVLIGVGDGAFNFAQNFVAGDEPRSVTTGDFNDDGITDLATANANSDNVSVLLGLSRTSVAQPRNFTYDTAFSQLTSMTDELGRVTLYEIDPANGNTLSVTQVIGELDDAMNGETDDLITSFTYTVQGLVDLITDPLDRITDFDYDVFGRLKKISFAVGTIDEAFQMFEYDDAGNQTAFVDENGNRTEFQYDVLNRLEQITETDPDGDGPLTSPITTFDYDENGNLIETVDGEGNIALSEYDVLDHLINAILVNGLPDNQSNENNDSITTFEYDVADNLIAVIDPLGKRTNNTYDARNRLVETIDPNGGITIFRYDFNNNLLSLTDPNENETRFLYDARDRLVREIDPLENATQLIYDPVNNLVGKTDRNDRVTSFVYDDIDRLISETWLNADQTIANEIGYSYDKASNLLSVQDAFSSLTFTYDNRDRVKTVDNLGTPEVPKVVLTYSHDGVGNVIGLDDTIDGVGGASTVYEFDALNRISLITQSGIDVSNKRVDFAYNQLGQFASIDRFSDLAGQDLVVGTSYQYDDLSRLIDLRHNNGSTDLAFYEFTYDFAGRITSINDIDGLTTYAYDARDQLTGAERDEKDLRGDESYLYDANGNRLESHLHGSNYVTGPANRLLSDGTYNYDYDAEGNMIRRTDIANADYRVFEYDHRNRLVGVVDFSSGGIVTQEVTFTYDAPGRRISKTVQHDGDGVDGEITTHFIYDRADVVIDMVDADGSGPMLPKLFFRYVFGPNTDQILAFEDAMLGQTFWPLPDQLGSIRDILDSAGIIRNHVSYDSFGNVVDQSDPTANTRYLFTGREYDPELNLWYYRARFYDAQIGRLLSFDALAFLNPNDASNPFIYVENNPISRVDPFGLQSNLAESPVPAEENIDIVETPSTFVGPKTPCEWKAFNIAVAKGSWAIAKLQTCVIVTSKFVKQYNKRVPNRFEKREPIQDPIKWCAEEYKDEIRRIENELRDNIAKCRCES